MKIPVLTLDLPNLNHRVFPKAVVEKAIEKYKAEHVANKRALVVKRLPENSTVNLKDVIGIVTDIGIEGDKVMVDVNFLPELKEAFAAQIGISSGKLAMRTAGIGTITKQEDGTYKIGDDYEILSCFITDDPA